MTRRTIDFGELRSLLNEPPDAWAWQQLCALVFPWELEACAEQWLPYAEDMLDRGWPDALRVWPQRWLSNRQPSAAKLVRALHIGQHPRPSWPDEAPISTRGQERLAEAPWFPRLHTLGLGDNINAHGILSGLSRHPRADRRLRRYLER